MLTARDCCLIVDNFLKKSSSDFCVDDVSPSVFLFTTKSTKDTKVSDISDSKCRGLRGEFTSSKGQPPGGVPTDLKGEFFASFGLLAIKSSLLRALRVLRGENFFTVKPEEAKKITGSQKTASGSRRHHNNSRLSGHLLFSEGSEQFKEHCAISGLVSALMLGSRSSRCRVVWPNLQS
jgi:hypothetical protein